MARHPQTPDCAIRGCERAARSYGLCGEHVAVVPLEAKMKVRLEMMGEQLAAGQRAARKVQRLAREAIG